MVVRSAETLENDAWLKKRNMRESEQLGWLARAHASQGIHGSSIDGVRYLIDGEANENTSKGDPVHKIRGAIDGVDDPGRCVAELVRACTGCLLTNKCVMRVYLSYSGHDKLLAALICLGDEIGGIALRVQDLGLSWPHISDHFTGCKCGSLCHGKDLLNVAIKGKTIAACAAR